MDTKNNLRQEMLRKRKLLSAAERMKFSQKITESVLRHPFFVNAEEIYCYVSYGGEVSTAFLMEQAWRRGKKVAVPRVVSAHRMEFYYIASLEELKPGYRGIPEPCSEKKAAGEQVLVVMPGLAFDKKGFRIGYGGGFYDEYLSRHPKYRRFALAFSLQCVEEIEADPHDICAEVVMTEKGLWMPC